ncbi:MAG: diaminopimelate epimerase [Chloroflexota bacterium]
MNSESHTTIQFTKMHGAGNDYVFIDGRNSNLNWSSLSISISDRHFGVGADGLIVAFDSKDADIRMQMYNLDGSEGMMCGNGIRCFVAFGVNIGLLNRDSASFSVETASGILEVTPIWENDQMVAASVNMGLPKFLSSEVPFILEGYQSLEDYDLEIEDQHFAVSALSMGNPHAVTILDTPISGFDLAHIGPKIENHPMFPQQVNFEIINILNRDLISLRVWERGSGQTLACGTGACAAAVIAIKKGLVNNKVTVKLPGGDLEIQWENDSYVYMKGPIKTVFQGRLHLN